MLSVLLTFLIQCAILTHITYHSFFMATPQESLKIIGLNEKETAIYLGSYANYVDVPYRVATLNKWNFLSRIPLTTVRKLFNLALNDSAEAFVLRLIK